MYRIPSEENVAKVVVDDAVIKGESDPLLVYETPEQPPEQAKAAPDE
jgi:ATP-dependent Clp protease ATP-binding subunit ClpX